MTRHSPICAPMFTQWSVVWSNSGQTVPMRVGILLGATFLSVAALAGCSAGDETPTTTEPTLEVLIPEPEPSIDVEALWAGSVCLAIDDVQTSIGEIAGNLSFDPLAGQGVLEQLEAQLALEIAGLEEETAALGAAIGAAPVDYAEAASTITELQTAIETTQAAGEIASGHLEAAVDAGNPLSAAVELGQAAVAAKSAIDAGTAAIDLLAQTREELEASLGPAFDRAPECQTLVAPSTP